MYTKRIKKYQFFFFFSRLLLLQKLFYKYIKIYVSYIKNIIIHADMYTFTFLFDSLYINIYYNLLLYKDEANFFLPIFFIKTDENFFKLDEQCALEPSILEILKKKNTIVGVNKFKHIKYYSYLFNFKFKENFLTNAKLVNNVYLFFKNFLFFKLFKVNKNNKNFLAINSKNFKNKKFFIFKKIKKYKFLYFKQFYFLKLKNIVIENNNNVDYIADNLSINFLFKEHLKIFYFFFKIKNFSFFNMFFTIFYFLPARLIVNYLKSQIYDTSKYYLLNFKKNYHTNLWTLFFIEYSFILKKKFFFLTFFYIFITKYLELLCNARVCLQVKNCSFNLKIFSRLISWIAARTNSKFKKFNRFFYFYEFLEILILSLWKQDIKFFELWLVKFLEKIHFKYHKNFFFLLNKFIKDFFKILQQIFFIKGLKFDIRGKVSVSGNAKKRHYLIIHGKFSLSTKSNIISSTKNIVPTQTGVLGLELVLVY